MKKQFLFGALMIVTGICLSPNSQNSLKTCTKETATCKVEVKKEIKVNATGYIEDQDALFNLFMNPLIQL